MKFDWSKEMNNARSQSSSVMHKMQDELFKAERLLNDERRRINLAVKCLESITEEDGSSYDYEKRARQALAQLKSEDR